MNDEALLHHALDRLKQRGAIEYSGEFGAEITAFIPFARWLKAEGWLNGRKVISYPGMRPYYYFLDDGEYAEKAVKRAWLPPGQRDWPSNDTYTATRQPWHMMPDYRAAYRAAGPGFERPILFVQNKFCIEWNSGPINYMPLQALNDIFALAGTRFDVVYSRPREMGAVADYTTDNNHDCDYPDLLLARRFPQVIVLEDFCRQTGSPYNLTKLQILAKCHVSIAVQGGGAHLLACFGDALMLLLHREGPEHPHAYKAGAYKYLADPPPLLLVAHDRAQFARGVALIADMSEKDGKLEIPARWVPVLAELRV